MPISVQLEVKVRIREKGIRSAHGNNRLEAVSNLALIWKLVRFGHDTDREELRNGVLGFRKRLGEI
jgi:hypothetical protein